MDLDELVCTICSSQFDKDTHLPLMVPKCGHTFCSKCIQDTISKLTPDNDFICPEDQTPMKLENRDISEFPQNFTLLRLMEKRTQALSEKQTNSFSRRDRSEKSPSSTRDLSSPMGSPGAMNRSSISLRESFNQHDMFNLIHGDSNMCREHGRKLEVVCLEHKCRICANCALFGAHKNHEIKPEEEVLKEIAGRAERLIDVFQAMEKSQSAIVEQETAERVSERIKKKCEEVNRLVKQKINDYVNALRIRERKILTEVSEKFCRMEEGFKQMRQIPQELQDRLQKWKTKTHDSLIAVTEKSERGEIAFDLLEDRANMKNDLLVWGEKFILELERINEVNLRFLESSLRKINLSFDLDFLKNLDNLCTVEVPDPGFFRPNEAYSMSNIRDDVDSTLPLGDISNKSPIKTPTVMYSETKNKNNFLEIDKNDANSTSRSPIKQTASKFSDKLGILDSDSNSSQFKLDTISDRPGGTLDLEDDNNLLSFEWKDLSTENQLADLSNNFGKEYSIKVNGHTRLFSEDLTSTMKNTKEPTASKIPNRKDNIHSQGQLNVPVNENQAGQATPGGKVGGRAVSPSKKAAPDQSVAKPVKTKKKPIKVAVKFEGVVDGIEQGMTESADLTGAELGDQGILNLIEHLKENTALKSLKLLKNKISDEGGIALANLFYHNQTIQTLNLTQNQLSEKTLDAFIEAVRSQDSVALKTVYFSQNSMSLRNVKSKLKELADMGVNAVV